MKISRKYKKGGNNTNIYINTKNNNLGNSNISPSDILDNPQVEKAVNKAGVSIEEMKNYLTPAINELKKHLTPANLMKATIGFTNARRQYEKQVLDMFKSNSSNANSGGKKTKKYKKYKNKTKRKRRRRRR